MHRLILAALLLVPAAVQAAVLCPATRDSCRLQDVMLFDGPPAELASLVPQQRGRRVTWEVAYIRKAGRRGHLICGYGRDAPNLEVEVPAGARVCAFTLATREQISGVVECN